MIIVDGGMEDLREYADRLVTSVLNAAHGRATALPLERTLSREEDEWLRGSAGGSESGLFAGCREAVEIMTRNPKKGRSCKHLVPTK